MGQAEKQQPPQRNARASHHSVAPQRNARASHHSVAPQRNARASHHSVAPQRNARASHHSVAGNGFHIPARERSADEAEEARQSQPQPKRKRRLRTLTEINEQRRLRREKLIPTKDTTKPKEMATVSKSMVAPGAGSSRAEVPARGQGRSVPRPRAVGASSEGKENRSKPGGQGRSEQARLPVPEQAEAIPQTKGRPGGKVAVSPDRKRKHAAEEARSANPCRFGASASEQVHNNSNHNFAEERRHVCRTCERMRTQRDLLAKAQKDLERACLMRKPTVMGGLAVASETDPATAAQVAELMALSRDAVAMAKRTAWLRRQWRWRQEELARLARK